MKTSMKLLVTSVVLSAIALGYGFFLWETRASPLGSSAGAYKISRTACSGDPRCAKAFGEFKSGPGRKTYLHIYATVKPGVDRGEFHEITTNMMSEVKKLDLSWRGWWIGGLEPIITLETTVTSSNASVHKKTKR